MPDNNLISRVSYDDIVDVKQQSLYARLKRLFATDVVVRNVGGKKLKIKDSDELMYATDRNSLRDRFNRVRSTSYNAYTRDFALSYQAARLDLFRDYDCVGPDTIIPLPDGSRPTISELSEMYKDKPQERFWVFSYDHKTDSVKLGKAYHPRKKEGKRIGYKVTFENGQFVIGSLKHPFMMRDGSYKMIYDLRVGDSVMPFNRNWISDVDPTKHYEMPLMDIHMKSVCSEYKIVSVESIGPVEVYDVTVEEYHNFATDSCFVSNTMDMDPILSSALDIYADECVGAETLIPLLDGSKKTIESLYLEKVNNFWVYSSDINGNFTPQLCERVAYNGKKKMYKITLDDNTELNCTSNHIWVKSDNVQILTENLKVGDSLKVFSKKLSDSDFMPGYEMLLDGDGTWKYTHRVVANSVKSLIQEKNAILSKNKVIHHASFDKLNNSPEHLQWVDYTQHKLIHAKFNKELWSNPSKTHEYKEKTILGHKKYWTELRRKKVSVRQKKFMTSFLENLTELDRKNLFANYGEKNGMYKNGQMLTGNKNGRWKNFNNTSDVNKDNYEKDIIEGYSAKKLREKYNLNAKNLNKLNTEICKKYGIYRIYQLKRKLELDNLYKNISIPLIKFHCENEIKNGKNILRDLSSISNKFNITNKELFDFITTNGYSGIKDLMSSNNHKITSIEMLEGEYDAYDLVNVGNSTHLYAIECKDGSKLITHNCLTENEMGEILTIDSKNNNIKDILHNLFYDILNVEFNLWSWIRNMPVKYDSYIPLLTGENIRIDELSRRMKLGEEFWVYSVQNDTNQTVPGKVVWCDKNYTSNKTIKVIFDDDSFVETSPEHPFLLRDGTEKRADSLVADDSLMPFYRKLSPEKGGMNKYEMLYNPSSDTYDFTHRIVARYCNVDIDETNRILHHKNFNKYDNSPTNLVPMEFFEHRKLHADHCIKTLHTPEVVEKRRNSLDKYLRSPERKIALSKKMKGVKVKYFDEYNNSDLHTFHNKLRSDGKKEMWADPVRREKAVENIKKGWDNVERRELASKRMKELRKTGVLTNHKVKRIEIVNESADVYCMTVVGPNGEHDRHNFAVCGKDTNGNITKNSGVFVKNCKYGDFYLKLNISPEYGVYLVEPTSAYNVERIENSDPLNKNYVKFQLRPVDTSQAEMLESFQIAHFRLMSDSNFLPYGKSMIEPARRVWKQLSLLEDAMLIHRIMRAPEKRIFKIDIGNIPPNEVDNFMEKTISKLKKVPYLDERTGDYNLKFNLMNMVEDFYLPVRGSDSGASIDTLPGMEFTGIDDLEYVKNKMMAALKIPKAFLGFEEGISGKATLAAEDVRFARTIGRLQKMVISELNKIAMVHLYAQGYRDSSLVDFTIGLTNPSTIFEKEKMEIWGAKLENAKTMWEMSDSSGPLFARKFVFKKIFKMSDDDIQTNEQDVIEDCKQLWRLKQIAEEGNDPAKPFKKINPEAGEDGESSDGPGGGPSGIGGGLDDELEGEPAGGESDNEPPSSGSGADLGGPVKESTITEKHGEPGPDYVRPSQEGEKDASKYPRGEDPLGDMENNRKSSLGRTMDTRFTKENFSSTTKNEEISYKKLLESGLLKKLDTFLVSGKDTKKELLKESNSKSMLDEGNIIE